MLGWSKEDEWWYHVDQDLLHLGVSKGVVSPGPLLHSQCTNPMTEHEIDFRLVEPPEDYGPTSGDRTYVYAEIDSSKGRFWAGAYTHGNAYATLLVVAANLAQLAQGYNYPRVLHPTKLLWKGSDTRLPLENP
jgi:hypothetical protein